MRLHISNWHTILVVALSVCVLNACQPAQPGNNVNDMDDEAIPSSTPVAPAASAHAAPAPAASTLPASPAAPPPAAQQSTSGNPVENGLLAYWPLNDAKKMADQSGKKMDGRLLGSGATPKTDDFGQYVELDGKTAFKTTSTELPNLLGSAAEGFTLSIWVKTGQPNKTICGFTAPIEGSKLRETVGLYCVNSANVPHLLLNDGKNYVKVLAKTPVTDNKWHSIVATVDYKTKVATIYIDGKKEGAKKTGNFKLQKAQAAWEIPAGSNNVRWIGALADNKIWNRVLSNDEVLAASKRK